MTFTNSFDDMLKKNMHKIGSNGAIALSMAYARMKSDNKIIPY